VQYFCGGHLCARKQLCQLDFKPNVVKTAVACLDIYFYVLLSSSRRRIKSDNNFSRNRHLYIVVQLRGNIFIGVDM
jgi:hypothetical protein